MPSDRIEKKIVLRAPLARVWRAVVDSKEFGHWFGVRFDGPFVAGEPAHGVIVGTAVNAEVAAMQKVHAGLDFDITIAAIEPQRLFSFRWHPHAIDKAVDYSSEPTTLVTFELQESSDGVLLTVTESGFDAIPLARRATAFSANDGGWTIMVKIFGEYVDQPA